MPEIHGVFLYDKPVGPTSHDVVLEARRRFRTRRIGHAGTLDPMASGLLVLLLGEATKLSNVLTLAEKEYLTTVEFGVTTSSFDAQGTITGRRDLPDSFPDPASLEMALRAERERTLQVPPQVSAIKVSGKRGHERARAGEEFELEPRDVRVFSLELTGRAARRISCRLVVSKGYYVRALARDLGTALSAPAHLTELRRVRSGSFHVEQAFGEMEEARVLPLASIVKENLPWIEVSELEAARLASGKLLGLDAGRAGGLDGELVVAAMHQGELAALIEPLPLEVALRKLEWDAEVAKDSGFSSWFKVKRGFQ
jgi:tRNA pseudouridine55 synthase